MITTQSYIKSDNPEKDYTQLVSLDHRKKYAQFFTPYPIAEFMSKWILGNSTLKNVLDPAFGLGVFARAIRKNNKDCIIKGFDTDETVLNQAKLYFGEEAETKLFLKDYMFNDWESRYDGIICNPPYFKFHDYDNKKTLKEIECKLGLRLNGFTNLYTLFLLKSAYQLNKNGRSAYIVPSEFLNSDYGELVKKHLIKNRLLRYVIVFDFEENIFEDVLTTSSILLFANDKEREEVQFINVKTLDELLVLKDDLETYPRNSEKGKSISFCNLDPKIKWRAYYQQQNSNKYNNLVSFSSFGKVVRGIATGANKYFTLSPSEVKEFNIPENALLPCICKSRDVKSTLFTTVDFKKLKEKDQTVYLFNGLQNVQNKEVQNYINKGERDKVNERYLTKNRTPWFRLENRPPAPIWVSVFNRKGIRFIRNEANISNLTTFHCIYPIESNLFSKINTDLLFAYLLTKTAKEIFNDNRREYGDGLEKFEPNDLNRSKMLDLSLLTRCDIEKISQLYKEYKNTLDEKYIDSIDLVLKSHFSKENI